MVILTIDNGFRLPVRAHDAVKLARTASRRLSTVRREAVTFATFGLSMVDEATIREAAERIVAASPGAQVVLFGSQVRGTATERSDVDLLVITPEVENTAMESVRLRRELRDVDFAIDLVVVRRTYVEEWRDVQGSFVCAAMAEGRLVSS